MGAMANIVQTTIQAGKLGSDRESRIFEAHAVDHRYGKLAPTSNAKEEPSEHQRQRSSTTAQGWIAQRADIPRQHLDDCDESHRKLDVHASHTSIIDPPELT